MASPGCVQRDNHTIAEYAVGELERDWVLFKTPAASIPTTRKAVALDCEMGVSVTGDSELIRVSMVDYFSGETLVDSLVYPAVKMWHFHTRYTGVTQATMENARRAKECIRGRDDARRILWQYIGPDTVVVMHGGKADLLALRIIHRPVIDTYLVENLRKGRGEKRSLKHLARIILARRIQQGCHNSLEDARTCRELAHWYVENEDGRGRTREDEGIK